jgi:hypothetical protein
MDEAIMSDIERNFLDSTLHSFRRFSYRSHTAVAKSALKCSRFKVPYLCFYSERQDQSSRVDEGSRATSVYGSYMCITPYEMPVGIWFNRTFGQIITREQQPTCQECVIVRFFRSTISIEPCLMMNMGGVVASSIRLQLLDRARFPLNLTYK